MHKFKCKAQVLVATGILLASSVVWAAVALVTSKPVNKPIHPGQNVSFVLDVDCATGVAGVNGEMRFDPALLSQPRVVAGSGASGFTIMGNEVEPGRFRFLAYKAPTAAMDLNKPALEFTFTVAGHATANESTKVTYSIGAAAKADGVSYGNSVAFADVTLDFKTSAQLWTYY